MGKVNKDSPERVLEAYVAIEQLLVGENIYKENRSVHTALMAILEEIYYTKPKEDE